MACCIIVVDYIVTGIDEKSFSKNRLVKVNGFGVATLPAINHHINLILKKKTDVIMLHVGTNNSKTLREILNDLPQLKSVITKVLSKSTLRVDNGKAALTLLLNNF